VASYESGPGESCATDCIPVDGGDVVKFTCTSQKNNKICSIDHIEFYGSAGARKLVQDYDIHPTSLPSSSRPSIPEPPQHYDQKSESKYTFTGYSEPVCTEETASQTCLGILSEDEFNCCKKSGDYGCGTCAACDGKGQLLNGLDEMGRSCCDDSYLAENTTVKCLGAHAVINYDMCCKTTSRKGTSRPQDFYCFLDKGSPEGNFAYCLGIADNPPDIMAWKRTNNDQIDAQASRFLRAKIRQRNTESTTFRFAVLFLMLYFGVVSLYLFKKMVGQYHLVCPKPF